MLASDSDEKRQRKCCNVSYFYEEANTRITGYLNENITYTEEIDPKNTDISGENQKTDAKTGNFVTDFLMTEKKGYSVHYASAVLPDRVICHAGDGENASDDGTILCD